MNLDSEDFLCIDPEKAVTTFFRSASGGKKLRIEFLYCNQEKQDGCLSDEERAEFYQGRWINIRTISISQVVDFSKKSTYTRHSVEY